MSKDMINHPDHYKTKNGLETIDVIEAFTEDLTGIEAVCTGNAIKYICRWNKKNGVEDINKAIWYLKKLREELHKKHRDEKEENKSDLNTDGPIYKWIDAIKKDEENKEEKQNEDKDKNEDWWAEYMIKDLETVTWPPAGDEQKCNDIKKVLRNVVKEAYLKRFVCAGSTIRTNSREDLEDFLLHLEDYDRDVFTKGHCLNSNKIIVWSGTQTSPINIPYEVREDIIVNWDGYAIFMLVDGQLKAMRACDYDGQVSPLVWKK